MTPKPDQQPDTSMPLMYAQYLQLDQVLGAQQPRSDGPEHDELLFIIIHQVYELWFKEILHELDYLRRRLGEDDLSSAMSTLRRILTILKVLVSQIDVLETITPIDYLTFRDRLESGSGFQSLQFREFEFTLGPSAGARSTIFRRVVRAGKHSNSAIEKRRCGMRSFITYPAPVTRCPPHCSSGM